MRNGCERFAAGSVLSSFLIGVAMGNIAWGVSIGARGEFAGTLTGLLKPYALLLGITTVTIYNAASTPKTLGIMLNIAVIGVLIVLTCTVSIYWIFRGKVRLDKTSH